MIKHLTLYFISAWLLNKFFDFGFFQVIVICLLIGLYNMVYTLLEEVDFYEVGGEDR